MKAIIILCDFCGTLGGAHHRSAAVARQIPGWTANPKFDLCPSCAAARDKTVRNVAKQIRHVGRVVALRDSGMTFQAIGDEIGISRQRVQQIWKKWREDRS